MPRLSTQSTAPVETRRHSDTLDPTNGAVLSTIGATNFNHVTGLAVHPVTGMIYGFSSGPSTQGSAGTGQLLTIDPTTGAATAIGGTTTSRRISDIGFDPLGTLYGWCQKGCGGQIAPDDLVIIDLADGSDSIVGDSGLSSGKTGLASDSLGGLFMNIVNSLNTINPANGLSTGFVNISAIPGLFNSLAFDPTDQLFGISRGGSAVGGLMAIDLGTETATLLGNSGIQNLSAIAFSMDVPEPTALSLFGFALGGLGVARRRRAS